MKYKVIFVCYLSKRGVQHQLGFLTKVNQNIRLNDSNYLPKFMKNPLIDIEFFKTKEEALKELNIYCPKKDIHKLID